MKTNSKQDIEINTLVEYIKGRSWVWHAVLEVLYEHRHVGLAEYEIRRRYIKKYNLPPKTLHGLRVWSVLKQLEKKELVKPIKIKGLRGIRWCITEKGVKVFKVLSRDAVDKDINKKG